MPMAMVTAESGAQLRRRARRRGIPLFVKPIDPSALEAFLARVSMREVEPQ